MKIIFFIIKKIKNVKKQLKKTTHTQDSNKESQKEPQFKKIKKSEVSITHHQPNFFSKHTNSNNLNSQTPILSNDAISDLDEEKSKLSLGYIKKE